MESVLNNQDLELLKEEALDIGVTFSPNIGYDTLLERVEEKKAEIAENQAKKKEAKAKASEPVEKIKVIVESRDGDDIPDQFIGFNGKSVLIQFGEEIEIDKDIYEFMKTVGSKQHKFKLVNDEDGIPRKQWYKKFVSRFIIQTVD